MTTTSEGTRTGTEHATATNNVQPYEHILVALDGSVLAEQVLPHIEPLATAFGSRVTCLCAVEPVSLTVVAETQMPGGYVPIEPLIETERETRTEDAAYLDGVRTRLVGLGFNVDTAEPEGPAAAAIVDYARQHRVDLIAMTTHGRSGLGRVLLGSVAERVVRTAPCPVLLVKLSDQT